MTKVLKRFLVGSSLKSNKSSVSLSPEETHHLKDVLRIKAGSKCLLFDKEGNEFVAEIRSFKNNSTEVKLLEPVVSLESSLKLTVAQAIPQDRKMDEIVAKAAELGIYQLIPLVTKRTIVRISESQFEKVLARWERILGQAAKQSRISKLPDLPEPISFADLCDHLKNYDGSFILHPSKEAKPIREIETSGNILLMIGPEGGFSDEELKLAKQKGAQAIKMGPEIMRTDTAFVAAAGFFKLMCES